MKNKNELLLILLSLLPFVYIAILWRNLPESLPMHWNINGEIDRWGSRREILLIPLLTSVLSYFLLMIIPRIDPKRQLHKMGNKYQKLRWIMAVFMTALALVIIHSISQQELKPTLLFSVLGLFFAAFGNYFKTIRHNYFIGIRTPWTLENETVWQKTHELGGWLWFFGGLGIVLLSILMDSKLLLWFFIGILCLMVFVPVIYSYLLYRRENRLE